MLLIHDIKYSDLLYNLKELQPGESGTITVSYEAEQPGDFYRTVDIYGNIPNNSLMVSFIGTVK
jgi:hypothetical protein